MFKHQITESVRLKTKIDWILLAFLAGTVNTGGWMACHRFVTHVTGFATLAGVEWSEGHWGGAFRMLSVPLYFLTGVMISAYLVDHRIHQGKSPRYALAMSGVSGLLAIAALGGAMGWFGVFGGPDLGEGADYMFLACLCMASGLQNAALTMASGATIRTTHLTGITTDLGIGLIRVLSLKSSRKNDKRLDAEHVANKMRLATILSFMLGSAMGATLFIRFHYLGLLLPAAIALYAALVALFEQLHETHRPSVS